MKLKTVLLLALLCAPAFAQMTPAQGNITSSGATCSTASIPTNCVVLQLDASTSAATIQVSGTYSATNQFEVSSDNQGTWTSVTCTPPNSASPPAAPVSSTTSTGSWQCNVAGYTHVRVRASAYTSGTAAVVINSGHSVPPNATGLSTLGAIIAPSASSSVGITQVVSASAESNHVLKASAGNLYSVYVTTGATAGFLMVFNATTAPVDGAVTPVVCIVAPANNTTYLNFGAGPPGVYSTGMTVVFSSTGCFTKTASATAFFSGSIQ